MPAATSVEQLQKLTAAQPRNAAAWHELGNALLDEGKVDRAISMYRRALRIDDSLAEVQNDLGTAYFNKGWHAEAEACFRKAIVARPDHGVAHANLGAALREQRKLGDSRRAFQRALALKLRALLPPFLRWRVAAPEARPAAGEEGQAALQPVRTSLKGGRPEEALGLARDAAARYPDDAEALHLLALAQEDNRAYADALASVRAAQQRKPDVTEFQITLVRLLIRAGEFDAAIAAAFRALKLEPASAAVHATIAGALAPWRPDLAAQAARHAIELDPSVDAGHGNLAVALWSEGRLDEAERSAREALRLNPKQINHRGNLAIILKDLGRIEEARELYRGLIADAPRHGKVTMDLGALALETEGDLETARRWFKQSQEADEPRAVLAEALIDFLELRFDAGWPGYEARKRVSDQRGHHDNFASIADWQGENLEAGRLLVYGEQGLGDEIMFASMLGEVVARAPRVTLLCEPRLGRLLARSFPSFEVIAETRATQRQRAAGLKDIRCKIAAGSLGGLFRRREADFPRTRGYLVADPARVADWRARLAALGPGRRVGLSWIGGVQRTGRSRRSLSLEQLRPVLSQPGVQWISLQHKPASGEIVAFRDAAGVDAHEFPGVTEDMDDLASLIDALDLVVSVCNTTVHVAGALGKDVLVMAPFVPEWRYGMSGERMIWYPSARMFRQEAFGKWDGVIQRIGAELERRRTL